MEIKLIPLAAEIGEPFVLDDHLACIGRAAPPLDRLAGERLQQLSRRHARIFREEGVLYMVDLGSRNGTFLNGRKLHDQPVVVNDGDEVRFGNLAFKLEEGGIPTEYDRPPDAPVFLELCHRGGDQQAKILVTDFPCLIGKDEDAVVQFAAQEKIAIPFLSRRHAHFYLVDHTIWLEDLGSTNGTYVNGERLVGDSHQVRHGDLIQFGKSNELAFSVVLHETIADDDRTEILAHEPEPEADSIADLEPRTVLMDKANTFLEIFCDDLDAEADPDTESGNPRESTPAPRKKNSVLRAWLNLFFGQSETEAGPTGKRKGYLAWVGFLLIALVVAGYWYWNRNPMVQAEKLAQSGQFQQSAKVAAAAVAAGDDSEELNALAISSAVEWLLPKWQQAMTIQDFTEAQALAWQYATEFPENEVLVEVAELLIWIGQLDQSVSGLKGNPERDLYAMTPVLQQLQSTWDSNKTAFRKSIDLLTQEYPDFTERHNTMSSQLRFISSNKPSLDAIEAFDKQLQQGIAKGDVEQLRFALAEFVSNYPDLVVGKHLQQDIGTYESLLNTREAHQFAQLTTELSKQPFHTRVFKQDAESALTAQLPDKNYLDRYVAAEAAWAGGNLVEAIEMLTALENENASGVAGQTLARYNDIISRYSMLLDVPDAEVAGNEIANKQLTELYQMLDPQKDLYIYRRLEPKFKQLQLTGRADTERKLQQANALWNRYQTQGGIKNLMRFEEQISNQFAERARELTESQRLFSAAISEADSAGVSVSKQDLELASLVGKEIQRQREAIEATRSVLGDNITGRKLELLSQ